MNNANEQFPTKNHKISYKAPGSVPQNTKETFIVTEIIFQYNQHGRKGEETDYRVKTLKSKLLPSVGGGGMPSDKEKDSR